MDQLVVALLWVLAGVLALAAVGFVALRWIAFRIARRVSEAAEARFAASLERGIRAAGLGRTPAARPQHLDRAIARLERLARIMDRLVPLPFVGGIGLDALLGLVPGVGDAVSFAVSSFIVIRAAQLGASPALLSRLIAIQCTDLILGAIPLVGDVFDAVYKADLRSAALIREALKRDGGPGDSEGA